MKKKLYGTLIDNGMVFLKDNYGKSVDIISADYLLKYAQKNNYVIMYRGKYYE